MHKRRLRGFGLRRVRTQGDDDASVVTELFPLDGFDPTTRPTLLPREDTNVSIDMRFEREKMRLSLGLADEQRPVPIDADGRFELIEMLGSGAMGAVYRALDKELDRPVALKVVSSLSPERDQLQQRLLQEARAMARLKQHPNVVQVYDVCEAVSGERIIALEYVEGQTLRRWQRDHALPEIVRAYRDAGLGLDQTHYSGVIHRDFKPDNVLVEDARDGVRVVVVDFGLAGGPVDDTRVVEGLLPPLDSTGLGTPEYMAPEQHHRPADQRCDQYSFCVSLWEAIGGSRPFGPDRSESDDVPRAPAKMPSWLYRILRRGLAWDPASRFRDMRTLTRWLEFGLGWHRFKRWGAVIGLATGMGVGIAWAMQPPPCADASAPIDAVWSDAARRDVGRALRELDTAWADATAAHAIDTLDAVAQAWGERATQICVAGLEPPIEGGADRRARQLARERACLDVWKERVEQVVELLRAGDRDLAEHLVEVLAPLVIGENACRVPPPPLDPLVRTELAQAERLEGQRRLEEALASAERATQIAERSSPCTSSGVHSTDVAAAHYRLGHVFGELERWDAAQSALRTAASHALACGNDMILFDVRVHEALAFALASQPEPERANSALEDADSLLAAMASTPSLREAERWRVRGLIEMVAPEPNWDVAHAHLNQASEILEQLDVAPLARRVQVRHNIGTALQLAARHDQANLAYDDARQLLAEAVGSQHPATLAQLAFVDLNQGLVALDRGQLEDAERLLFDAAEHGEPSVAARAYAGWMETRAEAGDVSDAVAIARQLSRWLERAPALPDQTRVELDTAIGGTLAEAGVDASGQLVDAALVDEGLARLVATLPTWDELDPLQAAIVRYKIAAYLYQADRDEDALAYLTALSGSPAMSDQDFANAVLGLEQMISAETDI